MRKVWFSFFGAIIFILGCKDKEAIITIVDIAHLDRIGIAKQLSIVNKLSPRVIGLDFLLTTDSLEKDVLLAREIAMTENLVQTAVLHNFIEPLNYWDSLEIYHVKFSNGERGFSNIYITDDSVFVPELPMRQSYEDETVFAFSYLIGNKFDTYRVNAKYKEGDDKNFYFAERSIGRHFKIISATDLLTGNFDKKDLQDKIVLMGHVSDSENSFYLDPDRTNKISGVEIHANIIQQLFE